VVSLCPACADGVLPVCVKCSLVPFCEPQPQNFFCDNSFSLERL
jgi:hypothetical protein